MKQLKFLMVAFTLLIGVSLTSCLNSNDTQDTMKTGVGKVNSVYGSYSFKTTDGYTVDVTYSSVAKKLADGVDLSKFEGKVVYFGYDIANATVDDTAKKITDAAFTGCFSLENTVEVVDGTAANKLPNDSIENTPVISLANEYEKPSFMFDNYTLYLPANYNITKQENYLSLVYYTEEEEVNEGVLRLYLRYNSKGNAVSPSITSWNYYYYNPFFYLKFYNLSEVFSVYLSNKGVSPSIANYPTKIEVLAHENSYSTNLDDSQTQEKVYTVEYKTDKN